MPEKRPSVTQRNESQSILVPSVGRIALLNPNRNKVLHLNRRFNILFRSIAVWPRSKTSRHDWSMVEGYHDDCGVGPWHPRHPSTFVAEGKSPGPSMMG